MLSLDHTRQAADARAHDAGPVATISAAELLLLGETMRNARASIARLNERPDLEPAHGATDGEEQDAERWDGMS